MSDQQTTNTVRVFRNGVSVRHPKESPQSRIAVMVATDDEQALKGALTGLVNYSISRSVINHLPSSGIKNEVVLLQLADEDDYNRLKTNLQTSSPLVYEKLKDCPIEESSELARLTGGGRMA